ncbi:MAG TPA: trypsin-like peptidase domain-containing protein [Nitrososphaerales archaeon]|nr:trypsin-like peptidase domain-containing protein [Nitrososphaerales archaeon]
MQVRRGVGAAYWGILFVTVALTFLVTFAFVTSLNQPAATNSDQALINSLQSKNAQLQAQLAALTQSANGTSLGLNSIAIYQADSSGIVTVQGTQSTGFSNSTVLGSGFVVNYSNTDYVVTNYHVVAGVGGVTVTFQDGDAYPATTIGSDGYSDLAVLKVNAPASEFHPLQVVSSVPLVVGQPVAAIGNPFGLAGSMTVGIVSQLGRTISETLAGNYAIANVIQFSAAINPGNSGGPLLDANGAVVGITTATVVSSQGVGFAIPSDTILKELPFLIITGTYDLHPLLGISSVDMNYQLAQLQKTNVTYGALIENVTSGGPADKAGLMGGTQTATIGGTSYLVGGDIIVAINGTKIVNTDALSSYLAEHALAGQTVVIQIVRDGQTMSVNLVLGTRPPAPSA